MKIFGTENNTILLKEIGRRIQTTRVAASITQEEMAIQTGLSLSTIKRVENGKSIKMDSLFNILRILNLLPNLENLIPEQQILPTVLYDRGGQRKRASAQKRKSDHWKWGDEE